MLFLDQNRKETHSGSSTSGTSSSGYRDWQDVYQAYSGELPRAAVQFRVPPNAERAIELMNEFGHVTGDGDDWLQVGALKFFVDGGYTGAAAWTLAPYRGQPDYFGTGALIDEDGLYRISSAAHRDGWQMGFHAIGDAAIGRFQTRIRLILMAFSAEFEFIIHTVPAKFRGCTVAAFGKS